YERGTLAPEHRAALKRAVAALWEPAGGGDGDGASGSPAGEESHGGEAVTSGGLRAAELSAAVYGIQRQASVGSPKEEDGGGESLGDPVGDAGF
ncbi:unnamed protein product, partial [Ectocarpus sp. 8 AP-2014]